LAHLKEKNSDDWVHHMHVVQCKVNNRPSRARGNISPYSMYYSKTNKSCFASVLGRSYKCAKTEYGLRLAKVVLEKIKVMDPQKVLSKAEVEFIIKSGDDLFVSCSQQEEEDVRERKNALLTAAAAMLRHFHYDVCDEDMEGVEGKDDDGSVDRESIEDCDFMDWLGKSTTIVTLAIPVNPFFYFARHYLFYHIAVLGPNGAEESSAETVTQVVEPADMQLQESAEDKVAMPAQHDKLSMPAQDIAEDEVAMPAQYDEVSMPAQDEEQIRTGQHDKDAILEQDNEKAMPDNIDKEAILEQGKEEVKETSNDPGRDEYDGKFLLQDL
jgi:hypothetical protein